jgi:hypothetical protein
MVVRLVSDHNFRYRKQYNKSYTGFRSTSVCRYRSTGWSKKNVDPIFLRVGSHEKMLKSGKVTETGGNTFRNAWKISLRVRKPIQNTVNIAN